MTVQATLPAPKIAASTHAIYYTSRLLSQAGQGVFFAFLVLVAGPGAEGALGLGSVLVAMTVPAIVLGPLGGGIVDRMGARAALIAGAVLRLGAIAAGLLVLGVGEYAWAVAFVYSAASQVFSPAELALVATLGGRRPAGTHASLFALQFGGQAVGGLLLGPLLFVVAGTGAMLGGAVVAYAAVTVLASLLAWRLRSAPAAEAGPERSALGFTRALRFFGAEPEALYAVGMLAFFDVMIKSLVVAAPIFLKTELRLGQTQLVMLVATGIVGVLFGLGWAARRRTSERSLGTMRWALAAPLLAMFALAPVGDGMATLTVYGASVDLGGPDTLFLIGSFAALPAVFVLGAALSVAPVIARSVLTATAPLEQQGRVFAAESILSNLLVVPGLLAASLATELISARATVIAIGVLGSLVFFALEFASTRRSMVERPGEDITTLLAPDVA